MEFKDSNTGRHNTYNETRQGEGSQYINHVGQVTYNYAAPSRMDAYFRRLHSEIISNTTREIIEDLQDYKTQLYGAIGLEQKLSDGGFTQGNIRWALSKIAQYVKKATIYECYPSAQEINLLLFGEIKSKFDRYIFPDLKKGMAVDSALQRIDEIIVSPIMQMLNANGEHDEDLHYTSDHIYGMVFYLIDMSHISWKDDESDRLQVNPM